MKIIPWTPLFLLSILLISITSCNEQENTKSIPEIDRQWWKEGTLYQIYPQSFKDTDGDGFGDFNGIIEEMDYIEGLGISAVWMNPFFESPLVDNGYDVADYRAIHPRYGSMEDFEAMLAGFQERGIKFVLDVVVNHSSDQHKWFQEAKKSRDNPYYNYYHWWPAEKGKPPHRHSLFDPEGGWDYVESNNSYYLHTFAEAQPDLNWENPKLREEVFDIMKFWAEKGVNGFRLDAFQFASKDTTYPEFPEGHENDFIKWYGMRPPLHDYLNEMYTKVIKPYDVFAVAEGAGSTFEDAHSLVDADRQELQVAYHFDYVGLARNAEGYFDLPRFKHVFSKWDSAFAEKGWLAVFLSNHDNSRLVDRFGNPDPEFRTKSTQMLNTFLLSMRGTPYTYYGDELGMTNIDMPAIEEYVDISALGEYEMAKKRGEDMEAYMKWLNYKSRENGRTPMQWADSKEAGFTSGKPWKRTNPNYVEINVEAQNEDPNSVLNHFRKMTKLRKDHLILVYGDYEIVAKDHPNVYAYTRTRENETVLVLLNFSKKASSVNLSEFNSFGEILINNYDAFDVENKSVKLLPYQAIILKMS